MLQNMEAKQFKQSNANLIDATEKALATEIQKFLESHESISVIHPSLRAVAVDSIELGKLGTAASIIRHCAGEFCSLLPPQGRKRYWSLIDAFNFFQDATGTQWTYMTQERRSVSLRWANDELRSLQ